MITLTISTLIFCYVLITVISTLLIWVISGYKTVKRKIVEDFDYIWKCSVCFNTYVDSRHEDISVCTLCGSYNKREQYKGGAV